MVKGIQYIQPGARAAEKERDRRQDVADLRSGRKSAAQVKAECESFAFPREMVSFDIGAIKAFA